MENIVYVRVTPDYVKRAQARYRSKNREKSRAYYKEYYQKKKEEDPELWKAKRQEYQMRYYEKKTKAIGIYSC
jgi:hypothetical protein